MITDERDAETDVSLTSSATTKSLAQTTHHAYTYSVTVIDPVPPTAQYPLIGPV